MAAPAAALLLTNLTDGMAIGVGLPEPDVAEVEPEMTMDAMIEMLKGGESIRLPGRDPAEPEGFYLIVPIGPEGCPNIAVHYRRNPDAAYLMPCITHSGFPCQECGDEGDYWAFARAVIGALLAGRHLVAMSTGIHASSDQAGLANGYREVPHYGQGSEIEESRDGRPEEPQAESGEAVTFVAASVAERLLAPFPHLGLREPALQIDLGTRPIPTGSIEFRGDGRGTEIRVLDHAGGLIVGMTYEEAWRRLVGGQRTW